jgi:hypothetical protein
MLVSNYVCNRRREDRDMFDSRLPFGFGSVSDLCFLRSGALLTSSCMCYCGRLLCFRWFCATSLSKVGTDLLKNGSALSCFEHRHYGSCAHVGDYQGMLGRFRAHPGSSRDSDWGGGARVSGGAPACGGRR